MTPKVVIIGEAPGPRGPRKVALEGRVGRCLARLCGISYEEYLARFARANLLAGYPGPAKKGSRWAAALARQGWRKLSQRVEAGQVLVVLGWRAWAVVAAPSSKKVPYFGVACPWDPIAGKPRQDVVCIVAPHPSGVNHWWNDPINMKRAKRFWARIAARAAEATF